MNIQSPKTRKYVYGVATATLLLLAGKGVITEAEVPLYQGLAAAVTGLAFLNTDASAARGENDERG